MSVKLVKISKILFIFVTLVMVTSNIVYGAYTWNVDRFDNKKLSGTNLDTKAEQIMGSIISAVRIIALGIAIIMLLVLAMKYMMAAPGERADIKKHAVVYVVGAVVMFAASGILSIIQQFATNIK